MTPPLPRYTAPANHWTRANSSELTTAVEQYVRAPSAMTVRDIVAMRAYLYAWIMSTAFDDEKFSHLRATVGEARTHRSIHEWIQRAVEKGAGPL